MVSDDLFCYLSDRMVSTKKEVKYPNIDTNRPLGNLHYRSQCFVIDLVDKGSSAKNMPV